MDIFGILDPDPHENLCGSETLILSSAFNDCFLPVVDRKTRVRVFWRTRPSVSPVSFVALLEIVNFFFSLGIFILALAREKSGE